MCTTKPDGRQVDGPSLFHTIPMAGSLMRRFLGFRLGSHSLPVLLGHRSGVDRDARVCQHRADNSVGDEMHWYLTAFIYSFLRQEYSHLFGPTCGGFSVRRTR